MLDRDFDSLSFVQQYDDRPKSAISWRIMPAPNKRDNEADCKSYEGIDIARPPHYVEQSIEPIAAIEAWGLGFNLGNVVKYVARAGKKADTKTLDDLRKAMWYLNREIEYMSR